MRAFTSIFPPDFGTGEPMRFPLAPENTTACSPVSPPDSMKTRAPSRTKVLAPHALASLSRASDACPWKQKPAWKV